MHEKTIIQCRNYFEYLHLKQNITGGEFKDSTYTITLSGRISDAFLWHIINNAPTAKVTQKITKKNKSTYINLRN